MNLDRYDLETCSGESGECTARLVLNRHGDYVLFSDVETLIDEIRRSIQSAVDDINA